MKVKPYTWSSITDFHILMHKTVSDLKHCLALKCSHLFYSIREGKIKRKPTKFLLAIICLCSPARSQHELLMLKQRPKYNNIITTAIL